MAVIGSGSDTISLKMSEDQAQGVDARFSVQVDGRQVGGPQVTTASKAAGQTEQFDVKGNWGVGPHSVVVTFANNFLYPGSGGDRNLYVNSIAYNGEIVKGTPTGIYTSPIFPPNYDGKVYPGNAMFTVNDKTATTATTPTTSPGPISVGNGPDTLTLKMAEDPYEGDASFIVKVDGKQIGGTLTTTGLVAYGQEQRFDLHGNFGPGSHQVEVNFVNDHIGAFYPPNTPGLPPGQWAIDTTDRNLYLMGASLNGGPAASGTPWEFSSSGSKTWAVQAGSTSTPTPAPASPATAPITPVTTAPGGGMSFIPPAPTTPTPSSTPTPGTPSSVVGNTPAPKPTIPTPAATVDPVKAAGGSSTSWWSQHHGGHDGMWSHHHG